MANFLSESSSLDRAAPSPTTNLLQRSIGILSLAALLAGTYGLHTTPGHGAAALLALLLGGALGIAFECGRFCFFCIFRDLIERPQAGPLYAILTALAISGIGYAIVFGAFLPNPASGRLAPDAHIGPVSPALALAGLVFGLGIALSGACISGHLYRLGEGSGYALPALVRSLLGFGLGLRTWNWLYVTLIADAPVIWLPNLIGYGGSLIVHLLVLGIIALGLLRRLAPLAEQPACTITPAYLRTVLLERRWNPLVTGAIVGIISIVAYLRIKPLGVTSQLGSLSRTVCPTGSTA